MRARPNELGRTQILPSPSDEEEEIRANSSVNMANDSSD
jgi:hypothetical protein